MTINPNRYAFNYHCHYWPCPVTDLCDLCHQFGCCYGQNKTTNNVYLSNIKTKSDSATKTCMPMFNAQWENSNQIPIAYRSPPTSFLHSAVSSLRAYKTPAR